MLNQINLQNIKKSAKSLNEILKKENLTITHSHALEIISQAMGFKDWNTHSAILKKQHQSIKQDVDIKKAHDYYTVSHENLFLKNISDQKKIHIVINHCLESEATFLELILKKDDILKIMLNTYHDIESINIYNKITLRKLYTSYKTNDIIIILDKNQITEKDFKKVTTITYNGHPILMQYFINEILYNETNGIIGQKPEYPLDIYQYKKVFVLQYLNTVNELKNRLNKYFKVDETVQFAQILQTLLESNVDYVKIKYNKAEYYFNDYIIGESFDGNFYEQLKHFLLNNCFYSNDYKKFSFPEKTLFNNKAFFIEFEKPINTHKIDIHNDNDFNAFKITFLNPIF
jgi:hypothetical protein